MRKLKITTAEFVVADTTAQAANNSVAFRPSIAVCTVTANGAAPDKSIDGIARNKSSKKVVSARISSFG
jgi:hypothetical protein